MKQFACGDVVPDCAETFVAEEDEAILQAVHVHARDFHGLDEVPPALVVLIRQQIRTVTG